LDAGPRWAPWQGNPDRASASREAAVVAPVVRVRFEVRGRRPGPLVSDLSLRRTRTHGLAPWRRSKATGRPARSWD
jgi:hypothetical protein